MSYIAKQKHVLFWSQHAVQLRFARIVTVSDMHSIIIIYIYIFRIHYSPRFQICSNTLAVLCLIFIRI